MSAAQTTESTAKTFTVINGRAAFAAEFNALLDTIEVIRVPAVILPERDFSEFTL